MKSLDSPWAESSLKVIKTFESSIEKGLTDSQVEKRQSDFGKNVLILKKPISLATIFFRQLKSIIVLLLFLAAILSFFLGQWIEATSVIAVLFINTLIGFTTEYRAIRSMESLREMGKTTSTIIRNGHHNVVNSEDLVPGDIVLFDAGDIVSADIRICESSCLSVDESALTGESVPVDKNEKIITNNKIIAERMNMLFRGTFITHGSAKGVVTATGMRTQLGKIAKESQDAIKDQTPLEEKLDALGKRLVWISIGIAGVVAISGILTGKEISLMLETAVALAVASIPEGLPIVATMALAKGMWLLSKQNVLVNKLSAVETLGATSVIFTDKTGTLTENKMSVRTISVYDKHFEIENLTKSNTLIEDDLNLLLIVATLCNNATYSTSEKYTHTGDPMEIALLAAANKFNINKKDVLEKYPKIKEVAFNPTYRMMATYHEDQSQFFVAVKGAPEAIIQRVDYIQNIQGIKKINNKIRKELSEQNSNMSKDGLRILAIAYKKIHSIDEQTYTNLIFLGFIGLLDPAREDVKASVNKCKKAGIQVLMATGDQENTAKKIATDIELDKTEKYLVTNGDELGEEYEWSDRLKEKILHSKIFSRVSPEQKLNLIHLFQKQNYVVAMTGDGVNDAPALRKADIGIAMGLRGTQVAKDAADMILEDDRFESIVLAIKQGRIIYSNIQKFVIYLLSCNISEILIISIATIMNAPLPLLPLQILFLNLVTDVFPALALGMGDGDETYLNRSPRDKKETILSIRTWNVIFFYGLVLTSSVLSAFFLTLNDDFSNTRVAVTVSFLTLGLSQIFHVFNMRLTYSKFLFNDITKNLHIWGAVILCVTLMICSVQFGLSRSLLNLALLDLKQWIVVWSLSLFPVLLGYFSNKVGIGISN